jgi:hypothetical protein
MLYDVSVNADGDIFAVGRSYNAEVYQDTQDSGNYQLVATFPTKKSATQVVLNDFHLGYTLDSGIVMRKYTKAQNSGYGLKENFVFTSQSELLHQKREVNSISMSKQAIFASSLYEGNFVYYHDEDSSTHEVSSHVSPDDIFISDVDMEFGIHRMVAGSFNNSAEVFENAVASAASDRRVQTLTTTSQVAQVDLNTEGDLVLGLMNGDLLLYSMTWPYH